MNTNLKKFAALACASVCALSFTACSGNVEGGNTPGEAKTLGSPKTVEQVDYEALNTDGYKAFKSSVEKFAADFAAYAYADYQGEDNFAVSPISVYTALALSAECAANDTRSEILDALGVTHEQLRAHYSTLYRSLAVEHKIDDETTSIVNLANSIWVNDGAFVKQPCIDALSDNFYAYSYSADFEHNNADANKAVHDFVKEQTNGLIDKDFELPDETLFTLINALYLKTVWNTSGKELSFTTDKYDFTAKDGSVKSVELLQSDYTDGRAVEFDGYTTFYMRTVDGYKIKFILPKDGHTVGEVFTRENIAAVNAVTDYGYYDAAENAYYATRVLFPEYKCGYDEDIVEILRDKFDISLLFKDHVNNAAGCDFSSLSDDSCYCNKVQHTTTLTVDKTGIEGAAVTAMGFVSDSVKPITVEEEFIVDKAFGFIITDWQDITLFSGVVESV